MKTLDDIGNPDAPMGSRDWVQACNIQAQEKVADAKTRVTNMRLSLLTLQKPEYLELLTDRSGRPFRSFDHYCNEPQPWGLGFSADVAHAVLDEKDGDRRVAAVAAEVIGRAPVAMTRAEAGATGGRGHKALADTLKLSTSSDNPDRIASRLKRDHPAIAAAVERGEYASVRQGGIAAGFVKPRKSVTLGDPARLASRILEEGDDYARAVRSSLETLLESVIG